MGFDRAEQSVGESRRQTVEVNFRLDERFPLRLDRRGMVTDAPVFLLHSHPHLFEVGLCHEGAGVFFVGGKLLNFRTGDVIVVNGHEPHFAQSLRGTECVWTWLYMKPGVLLEPWGLGAALTDTDKYRGPDFDNIVTLSQTGRFNALLSEIIDEYDHRKEHPETYGDAMRALVARFLIILGRHYAGLPSERLHSNPGSMDRLMPALNLVARNYSQPLSVTDLAASCAMSEANFRKVFTCVLGKSPLEYVQEFRIASACAALRARNDNIDVVASDCGFSSLSSFNRIFKRIMGLSPREYRRGR